MSKNQKNNSNNFSLADWVSVFRVGTHTDSSGKQRDWSADDLQQIVSNFDAASPPPAVPGHPKDNIPKLAAVSAVRVDGDDLQVQFADVEPIFEELVKSGELTGRSVSIVRGDSGYALNHAHDGGVVLIRALVPNLI